MWSRGFEAYGGVDVLHWQKRQRDVYVFGMFNMDFVFGRKYFLLEKSKPFKTLVDHKKNIQKSLQQTRSADFLE